MVVLLLLFQCSSTTCIHVVAQYVVSHKLLVWSVGEEAGNRKSEHRGFSFGSVLSRLWRECEVDNKQALSGPVRCGTRTFSTHPDQHRGTCFKQVHMEEIPATCV